jgi:chromosome segregation ATPase
MLHLAFVEKVASSAKMGLRLIARQRSEYSWALLPEQEFIPLDDDSNYLEGTLVLATLSETRQVMQVDSANQWLMAVIQTFLKSGVTPAFLQAESERAEQWRQTLTLQSQDLDRRALELEARREQIEQLEESLKREKKQMETLAAQYKEQTQELDRRVGEVEALQQQIVKLEEALKHEQKRSSELRTQPESNSKPAN